MADKRLKIVNANTNFFGRVASRIRDVLVPTKLGVNSFLISLKRGSFVKAYKNLNRAKEGYSQERREVAEKRYKDAYSEYLEAIDKYIMDSIYTKVSTNSATKVEKKALADYYKITTYKNDQYDEYRFKKQLFLLSLDYELQNERLKKVDSRYEEVYMEKQTSVYRNLLKNYSIRLVDNTSNNNVSKNDVYMAIFKTLNEYVKNILPLEIKYSKTNRYKTVIAQYDTYKSYVGKLDEKENLEKQMLLLSMSRTLFTHSLPLGVVENCYQKLIKDTRILLKRNKNTPEKLNKAFRMIKLIVEEFNNKILEGKIYWEDKEEKKQVQAFWNAYKLAKTEDEKDILLCLEELRNIKKELNYKLANKDVIKIYKNKLQSLGVKIISGYSTKYSDKKFTRYINKEMSNIA